MENNGSTTGIVQMHTLLSRTIYAPDDAQWTIEGYQRILDGELGLALSITLDVSKISDVAGHVGRCAMRLAEGIEVRSCRSATRREVSSSAIELFRRERSCCPPCDSLDVEAPLCSGVKALQFADDRDLRCGGALDEGHRAACTMVALEDRDGLADIGLTEQVHFRRDSKEARPSSLPVRSAWRQA